MRQVLNIEFVPVLSLLIIIVDQTEKFILTVARVVYGGDRDCGCSDLAVNSAAIGRDIKGDTDALLKGVAGCIINRVQILLVLV